MIQIRYLWLMKSGKLEMFGSSREILLNVVWNCPYFHPLLYYRENPISTLKCSNPSHILIHITSRLISRPTLVCVHATLHLNKIQLSRTNILRMLLITQHQCGRGSLPHPSYRY